MFEYGSLQEQIAILEYTRDRSVTYLNAIAPMMQGEQSNKFMKNIRSVLFPEEKLSSLNYLKKSNELFEKLRGINLTAAALGKGAINDFRKNF